MSGRIGGSWRALAAVLAVSSVASCAGVNIVGAASGVAVGALGVGLLFMILGIDDAWKTCAKAVIFSLVLGYASVALGTLLRDWRVEAAIAAVLVVWAFVVVAHFLAQRRPNIDKPRKLVIARRAHVHSQIVDERHGERPRVGIRRDDLGLYDDEDSHG